MPKINRIRIANVPYSGKHIVDQLINCYDGQNVLLNLANGGGKSVLTQMIMQPIIPNVKIHKRKVESYLTSKEPTFVMIEWLLDNTNQPTYFLTGIVMNKTVTEENNFRVKYFTFINEYKSSNQYDIKNIEFITNENGLTKYKSYDYCLKTLRAQEGTLSKIETFSIDEQKRYAQILEQNGIFKDEWKILAKINEKEGGIDDLFEKCEKSDDVINQWILKTISEKLENSDELREMFLNLMMDVMEHEEDIKQKEELEAFKQEANLYIEELSELLKSIDKQEGIKKKLEEIYLKLNKFVKKSKENHERIKEQIEQKENKLVVIDYEELSEEYYKNENEYDYTQKEMEKKSEIVSNLDEEKKNLITKLRLLEAAKIYGEYKEAKAEREAAFIAKQNLENGIDKEKIRNIEYSLKVGYEEQIKLIDEQIENLKQELDQNNKKLEKSRQEQSENSERNIKVQNNLAVTKQDIKQFKENEREILQELGISLTRNILQELDQKEIENVIKNYNKIQEEKENSIQKNKEEIKNTKQEIINNEAEIYKLEQKIETLTNDYNNKQTEINIYHEETQKLKKVLENFAIDPQRMFDKEINLVEIERQREYIKSRNSENIRSLNKRKEILYSLKNGGIHVELELGKILDKNNIEYETGEEYLKEQPYEFQQKLLKKNPMLPYCYIILKSKDYEKIEELAINEEINRLTPIILYEDIETDFKPKNKLIQIQDKVKLECLYNPKAFDEKLKKEFEESLENEISELEEKIKEDEIKIVDIENSIKFIKEYKYTANDEQKLKEQLKEIQEEKDNSKIKKEELTNKNKELAQKQIEINNNINTLNTDILENENNKKKFNDFLEKDKLYRYSISTKNELEKILEQIEEKANNLNDIIENSNNEISKLQRLIEGKKDLKEKISSKNGKISKIENAKRVDNTIEELEKMYEEIQNNFSRDQKEIQEKIDKAQRAIDEKDKKLNKSFEDLKGQYEKAIYEEEAEDIANEQKEKIEQDLEYAKQDLEKEKIQKGKLETQKENIISNLRRIGKTEPLQAFLIKKDYDQRRKNLKEEIKNLNDNMGILNNEMIKIENRKNEILRIIDEPEYKDIEITDFDYNNLPIKDLAKEFKEKDRENEERKRKIDNLYREIENRNQSQKQNQVIEKFLRNMNPYQSENKFANYYFTFERVTECLETMEKMLQLLQTTIANIENDKNNIKHHAYLQGKNIYLEMKQISDSSDIKMPGKLRKVALLEIELPKELDQYAEERINDYIEECIKNLRQECKEQENIRPIIEKRIKDWLSDRQLLNIVINTETIGVKLYKIDISEKNSGLRRWEEVIVDNSGGEKLISCLIMVLALMQYTRKKVLAKYGDDEKRETSKFLIIDNPFGKMSSTHLLDGLMLILDRFNVQAICLSDISQSSITNQFKVIYQLSLKSGKYTDKIYLTTDNVIKSPELVENYLLEQAYVKVDSQIKLW